MIKLLTKIFKLAFIKCVAVGAVVGTYTGLKIVGGKNL